ncbi:probable inactive poly [ADP-ribose] polymerase SRO2 isoform X3 [Musa acuminata AAA Group]|uniref:probable inactive poly [ADP-ribose] polymerase SRO2 isoform X3 n=2 Tax=Musa acuminata AAA Group TaxID=214697 RepID=UPI0031DA1D1F
MERKLADFSCDFLKDCMEKKSNVGNGRSKSDDATGGFGANGMIKVGEESDEFVIVQHRFYTNIATLVPHCSLVELHRVLHSTPIRRSCWEAFHDQLKATQQKRGEHPNDKVAFYEAPKEKVIRTIRDGFDVSGAPDDGGYFGLGLYFTPEPFAINSVMSATADERGLRHVLLCRVILGAVEEVVRGSRQSQPSSHSFDSAVDNQNTPTRYIIWYSDAQTRVLPLYVMSIKVDFRTRGLSKEPGSRPTSPWTSIKDLISMLSRILPRSTMCQIRRLHNELMERKTTRQQLVRRIRHIAGDKILLCAIKSIRAKKAACSILASQKDGKS